MPEQLTIEQYDQEPAALQQRIAEMITDHYGTIAGEHTSIKNPREIYHWLQHHLHHRTTERFYILCLSHNNTPQHLIQISQGHLTASVVHPRETFRAAILHNAAGIILVHNHPSGNPEPSPHDRQITRKLVQAGQLLDIPVVDHIILAGDTYTSFVNRGILH